MAVDKTRAIVIRAVPFGETSSVVTLYCRNLGKLRALAKGAWRPKSGFDGALDLLSTCEVLVLRRSAGGLDLLTEACLEARFRVGGSLVAFLGGMHLAELVDALTAEADPQPELFDVVHASLRELSAPAGSPPAAAPADRDEDRVQQLLVRTELAALRLVGHLPELGACANCRGPLPAVGRTAFGMLDGGTLCQRCRGGRRAVVALSRGGLEALRGLATAAGAPACPDHWGEVRSVMSTYLAHLLGRPLRVAGRLQPRSAAAAGRPRPTP